MTDDDPLINSTEAAKIAGFKNTCSFTSWAKAKGLHITQKKRGDHGGRPYNFYRQSDILKAAKERDASQQKTDNTISVWDAAKVLGYKNAATVRELVSRNKCHFEQKTILENGKLKKYYSLKNILEVKELIKNGKINFRNSRKEVYGTDDDDEEFDPSKKYQDGFLIKDTPLIDIEVKKLTIIFYKISNNIRVNLCKST